MRHGFKVLINKVIGSLCLAIFLVCQAQAFPVTIGWDEVSNATGYMVYIGTESRNYGRSIDAGNVNQITVEVIEEGDIFYFALIAYRIYDYGGEEYSKESDLSNEVIYIKNEFDFEWIVAAHKVVVGLEEISIEDLSISYY